jgi:hypothetical protein
MYTDQDIPELPDGINEAAADFWRFVHEATPLSDHERTILARLCKSLTLIDELEAALRRDGDFTLAGVQGSTVVHPLLPEIRLQLGLINTLYRTLKLHEIIGEMPGSKPTAPADPNVVYLIERATQGRKASSQ